MDYKDNAVIYARYSSSSQREESIEGQLRDCHEYAKHLGLNVIGEYTDHAISGTSDKRPDFQRMIRDSGRGQFKVVIVWKNDRFARNRYDSAIYKAKLKQNGVRVLSAKEHIPEGPEGIILESVMEGYAEYYSANLSQNVKRGMYDSALELKWLGQKTYGLRPDPQGRFEQDPATAPVVKRIFEEYASGQSAKDIYTRLNEEGYRTATGKPFNKSSLRRILQNEKYSGVYQYADIRVEDGIPAIVSKEMFEKVKKMLAIHHEKPAAKKIEGGFLLTGKLFCGHCGELMTGDGGTSKSGRIYQYYTCNNRRKRKCDKKRVSKEWIEDTVVNKLANIANDDTMINAFADRFMEWQEKDQAHSERCGLEDRLKQISSAIRNMMGVIESGFVTDSVKSRLVELEEEKVSLEKSIASDKLDSPILERDQVVYFLQRFREGDVSDISWRIFIVDTFLKAAYLYDDGKLLLCLNFSGENSEITLKIAEDAVEYGEELCSNFAPHSPPRNDNFLLEIVVLILSKNSDQSLTKDSFVPLYKWTHR